MVRLKQLPESFDFKVPHPALRADLSRRGRGKNARETGCRPQVPCLCAHAVSQRDGVAGIGFSQPSSSTTRAFFVVTA